MTVPFEDQKERGAGRKIAQCCGAPATVSGESSFICPPGSRVPARRRTVEPVDLLSAVVTRERPRSAWTDGSRTNHSRRMCGGRWVAITCRSPCLPKFSSCGTQHPLRRLHCCFRVAGAWPFGLRLTRLMKSCCSRSLRSWVAAVHSPLRSWCASNSLICFDGLILSARAPHGALPQPSAAASWYTEGSCRRLALSSAGLRAGGRTTRMCLRHRVFVPISA